MPKNMEPGCTEICTSCFTGFNCNIMLLSVAWYMQSALVKFDRELKMGSNSAYSPVTVTGDAVKQVAAMGQQTIVLLGSCAWAELD